MNILFKYIFWICLLSLFMSFGCTPKKNPPVETKQHTKQSLPDPAKEQTKKMKSIKQIYYVHVVRWDGESLSLISRWYIGNYKDWRLLAKHNPELNPSNIHVGDRVWIPKEKMKIFKQMPESFLNKDNKQNVKKQLELYGPKDHKEKTEEYSHDQ
ncbi:MAG: hypothetical protein KAI40_05195 [Desulfobacterales bacterium]|nr:hypothetical protein [Desulfobacterales bacterium]